MSTPKSTFQVLQLSLDLMDPRLPWPRTPWVPMDTYVIRADQLARTDILCWSPEWTKINFVILFGSRVQISTVRYGMLLVPGGLMVVVNRVGGAA